MNAADNESSVMGCGLLTLSGAPDLLAGSVCELNRAFLTGDVGSDIGSGVCSLLSSVAVVYAHD